MISSMLEENIGRVAADSLDPHPLGFGVTEANVSQLLADYAAMSEFFPYIQAGAHATIVNRCLEEGVDIPDSIAGTSVVAAFLCWDEFGGHHRMLAGGVEALPRILDTQGFHANMLKENLREIAPESLQRSYSPVTQRYLKDLQAGLSSEDSVRRVAHMVSFEVNAERMITGLYASLKSLFSLSSKKLSYFEAHVGGDDPAEAYHIETTSRLIAGVVNDSNQEHFMECFADACAMNRKWCEDIKGYEKSVEVDPQSTLDALTRLAPALSTCSGTI